MTLRKTTRIEKAVFEYLNELRLSGITNMFGASPYIIKEFPELDVAYSRTLLSLWMENFNKEGDYEKIIE